jgi:hypothetical protein
LGDDMVFGEEWFTSTRVNHILRVTKPNTKRVTIICPNSLSQIGVWGLRFNSTQESRLVLDGDRILRKSRRHRILRNIQQL